MKDTKRFGNTTGPCHRYRTPRNAPTRP